MGFAVATALVAAMLGSGLLVGGALLQWGGRLNEGRLGGHVWDRTTTLAAGARRAGTALVVAASVALGPVLWLVAALA